MKKLIIALGFFFSLIPTGGAVHSGGLVDLYPGMDLTGTIVRLIAFLLGMSGSMYLAAVLWKKSDTGAYSWKYLSVSMILFVFWNIVMTFGILMDVLHFGESAQENIISIETHDLVVNIINVLDPIIEVIVFLVLYFGLRKIVSDMREKPWMVFSKEEDNE